MIRPSVLFSLVSGCIRRSARFAGPVFIAFSLLIIAGALLLTLAGCKAHKEMSTEEAAASSVSSASYEASAFFSLDSVFRSLNFKADSIVLTTVEPAAFLSAVDSGTHSNADIRINQPFQTLRQKSLRIYGLSLQDSTAGSSITSSGSLAASSAASKSTEQSRSQLTKESMPSHGIDTAIIIILLLASVAGALYFIFPTGSK